MKKILTILLISVVAITTLFAGDFGLSVGKFATVPVYDLVVIASSGSGSGSGDLVESLLSAALPLIKESPINAISTFDSIKIQLLEPMIYLSKGIEARFNYKHFITDVEVEINPRNLNTSNCTDNWENDFDDSFFGIRTFLGFGATYKFFNFLNLSLVAGPYLPITVFQEEERTDNDPPTESYSEMLLHDTYVGTKFMLDFDVTEKAQVGLALSVVVVEPVMDWLVENQKIDLLLKNSLLYSDLTVGFQYKLF